MNYENGPQVCQGPFCFCFLYAEIIGGIKNFIQQGQCQHLLPANPQRGHVGQIFGAGCWFVKKSAMVLVPGILSPAVVALVPLSGPWALFMGYKEIAQINRCLKRYARFYHCFKP